MITLDVETRSYADLKKVGAWAYSEHPTTSVICASYGIDHLPVRTWFFNSPEPPYDLWEAIEDGHEVEAHNVAFEYSIVHNILAKLGWPTPKLEQWRDTMAVAAYYALPMALDRLARALNFPAKNKDGARLIGKYSKLYLKTAKLEIPPEDLAKWGEYCQDDVLLEQGISDYLGDLPERELAVFLRDLEMGARGIYLDVAGIEAATEVIEKRSAQLTEEFREVTGGLSPNQVEKVRLWLGEQGCKLDNLQAETLEDLIEDGELGQGPARRAIELRLRLNKASTKKLDAMSRQVGNDGRARFQTRYHGTSTGRNSGTGFQPLNLNRGIEKMDPEQLVGDIMLRDPEWLDCLYGDASDAVAKASRNFIQAEPGNRILAGDFVSIEAVLLACLAGEEWKIEAFKNREPMYEVMGCKIHNLPEEALALARSDKKAFKDKYPSERQDGKTGELAFGYQGALGAWLKFDNSGRHKDEAIIGFSRGWRAEHPMTTKLWAMMGEAAIEAVDCPGRTTGYRQAGFEVVDEWLTMILPDGKRIWYFKPELRAMMPKWHKPATEEECASGECGHYPIPQLTYLAQKEGQWRRVSTYGGKLTENYCQAVSRQILVPARERAERYGYPAILTVYDEIVAEVPNGRGTLRDFEEIMADCPGLWASGWPIMVEGWEGSRYKK